MDGSSFELELKDWLEKTKDEPLEGMAAFFDKRAGEYEAHMSRWREHYEYISGIIPANARNLLDIGCGTGLELDWIFAKNPDIEVVGVDIAGEMLAALKKKHPDKKLTLIQDDYFSVELGENIFDAAVAFETLHHFTAVKKTGLFRKLRRALKPEGVFIECDYISPTREIEDMLFAEYERRKKRDCVPSGTFVHFDTPLTLAHETEAIENAGLRLACPAIFLPNDDHTAIIYTKASK